MEYFQQVQVWLWFSTITCILNPAVKVLLTDGSPSVLVVLSKLVFIINFFSSCFIGGVNVTNSKCKTYPPCQHGGVCLLKTDSISMEYSCNCTSGYKGYQCQQGTPDAMIVLYRVDPKHANHHMANFQVTVVSGTSFVVTTNILIKV